MPGDLGDALGRDIAFVRTPERGRHDGLDRHVLAVREVDELARRDQRLGDAAAHVLLVVGLARGDHELELVGLRRQRELGALRVRHERAVRHAGTAVDAGHDLVGAGHRRDRFGRHERRGLDAPEPGARERVDQPHPVGDRHRRLVLQPVARSDLSDLDALRPLHERQFTCARYSFRRRTRILIGVGPKSNASRSLRSRYRR